jgi:hypothetical protein
LPILVRPVREQLEHDRVIRLLQDKWRKKYDVQANVGDGRQASIKVGQMTLFPDLVLTSAVPPKRLQSVVEVETGESVNNLEAMAQWAHMSRAKAAFQLYVPVGAIDQARRLCQEHEVALAELWSYYVFGEQIRFNLVQRDEALAALLIPKGPPMRAAEPAEEESSGRPAKDEASTARTPQKLSKPKSAPAKKAANNKPAPKKGREAVPAGRAKPAARGETARGAGADGRPPAAMRSSKASRPAARRASAPARKAVAAKGKPAAKGAAPRKASKVVAKAASATRKRG